MDQRYRPDELEFDLETREVHVKIGGKPHVIREAPGSVAAAYRNCILKCARTEGEGKMRLEGGAEAEHVLVQGCLFDQSGRKYPLSTIAAWPSRVLKLLFKIAKDISDLGETDETEEQLAKIIKEKQEKLDKMRAASKNGKHEEAGGETDPTDVSPENMTPG